MITQLEAQVAPYRELVVHHPLYSEIKTPQQLRTFMEYHVFAVWDFMSLLKVLQINLTCTEIPWKPKGDPEIRYLINEIVLAEETDINRRGERQSHFEMYLDAMQNAGAHTDAIKTLLAQLEEKDIKWILQQHTLPKAITDFLTFTFELISEGANHKIAAAFTFGREDLIPEMFSEIIQKIQHHFPEEDLADFNYYFDRHIALDGDEHGPMALKMVEQLCGNDEKKWQEATQTVIASLEARQQLWDGVLAEILTQQLA